MANVSFYLNEDNTALAVRDLTRLLVYPSMRGGHYGEDASQFGLCIALEARDLPFEDCVLLQKAFCLPGVLSSPKYLVNAIAKARSHHRTGHSSGELVDSMPALLRSGDCIWGGSVSRFGLIAAVSGFPYFHDIEAAGQVVDHLAAMVMDMHLNNIKSMRASGVAILDGVYTES